MEYTVKGNPFPGTLKGLTEAIKLAAEYAQVEPVDVLRGDGTVAFHVPKQPIRKERIGNYPKDKK
jgi:hypothetical protein